MKTASTLSRRLLRSMLPWYLLATVGMVAVQLGIQYIGISRAIADDLASLGRTVEPAMTNAVWELDRDQMTRALDGVRQNAIVSGARIESPEGGILADSGWSRESDEASEPVFFVRGQQGDPSGQSPAASGIGGSRHEMVVALTRGRPG